MKVRLLLLLIACAISWCDCQKDPHWKHGRSTIVHLFEWRWRRIAQECEDFLQHVGYAAVQISPPTENVILKGRPWYERYQPISYKLITRSGNEEDFLNMTRRCNAVGIRIYADMIINHMSAPAENVTGTAGSTANPKIPEYPAVPYGPDDFHAVCSITNYQDINQIRNCALHGLRDLNQGEEYVRGKIIDLFNHLIDLGVAGFRIDAARHMWPEDLQVIYGRLKDLNVDFGFPKGARPFIYQEVTGIGDGGFTGEEFLRLGTVTDFKFGAELSRVFRGNDKLKHLCNWGSEWGLLKSGDALVFIDNHDNQRSHTDTILTYKDAKKYKMATAFMLAHPFGIPKIMSSFSFATHDDGNYCAIEIGKNKTSIQARFNNPRIGPPSDTKGNLVDPKQIGDQVCDQGWVCEHKWRQISNMVKFRNVVAGTEVTHFWTNGDQQIAFSRGNKGFIAFTNWDNIRRILKTDLRAGYYCDVISGEKINEDVCTGKIVQVLGDGSVFVDLRIDEFDGVMAIHSNSRVHNYE